MYFIYLNKLSIMIPRHMHTYSCTAPWNGYYLDVWRFINVLLLSIIIILLCHVMCIKHCQRLHLYAEVDLLATLKHPF